MLPVLTCERGSGDSGAFADGQPALKPPSPPVQYGNGAANVGLRAHLDSGPLQPDKWLTETGLCRDNAAARVQLPVEPGPASRAAGEAASASGAEVRCRRHAGMRALLIAVKGGGNGRTPRSQRELVAQFQAFLQSHKASDHSNSANDSPSSEAFVSKQDSAEVVRRHKRNYVYKRFYIIDPLEGKREICELNPDCDELADHIGFHKAYRRYYGAV
uniref:Osteocalcin n=1 Tax=Chelonia mydas TaxID=8469 RepID=A0AAD1KXM6_CHEMY|nr:bone gamma-carboxyglutamic acid-containing protein [Chelonia mydas]